MRVHFIQTDSVRSPIDPQHRDDKTYQVEVDGRAIGLVTGRYFSHYSARGETFIRLWIPTEFDGETIRSISAYSDTRHRAAFDLVRAKLDEDTWAGLREELGV